MNCFPGLLIDPGISEQPCLEDITVHLSLLMRCSDTKLIKYKQDVKLNWVLLIWGMSCLAACTVLLHSKGKPQEETGTFLGPCLSMWTQQRRRGKDRQGEVTYAPHRPAQAHASELYKQSWLLQNSYMELTWWPAPFTACALPGLQSPASRELNWGMTWNHAGGFPWQSTFGFHSCASAAGWKRAGV